MAEFCFVVERTEWDENLETGSCWEDRSICKVFARYEDAKEFVEKNAEETVYPMRWRGERLYSGRSVLDGATEEGLRYEIHYVPLII